MMHEFKPHTETATTSDWRDPHWILRPVDYRLSPLPEAPRGATELKDKGTDRFVAGADTELRSIEAA
jgi:hypothetical protein